MLTFVRNGAESRVTDSTVADNVVASVSMTTTNERINIFRHAKDTDSFPAGHVLFSEGDPGEVMFAVKSREVELLVGGRVVEVVSEGGVLGEMSLIDHLPRSATARIKQDCELVTINEQRFAFMVQQTPMFAFELMRIIARRLRVANQG
jgi:CRP-like cAMP-binding protein